MYEVILQSAALIIAGLGWRRYRPQGLDADTLRLSLTTLVYVLLLPSLVLVVLWRAPLSLDSLRVAFAAATGVAIGMGGAWLIYRLRPPAAPLFGALLLAAAFPNATYLGLPVLEAVFGAQARSIAVQYDLFACTPLLLSVGIMVAAHYGNGALGSPFKALLRVPPLWAALAGVTLNIGGVPLPSIAGGLLDMLAAGVVPLMLFAIGLGLRWPEGGWRRLPMLVPVLLLQLLITPALVWGLGSMLGLQGWTLQAVVLEAAMPSMVLGIVLCDRYALDTALYSLAVTLSTALAIITLPLWFGLLGGVV